MSIKKLKFMQASVCAFILSKEKLTLIELSADELISTGSLAKKCSEVITPS
jgi:hypothetical protein